MNQKAQMIADLLKVLANQNRLLLLCALIDGPCPVSDLASFVPTISQSALSQHLNLLKAHGILGSTKKGQQVTYFIADERTIEVIQVLKQHYCTPA